MSLASGQHVQFSSATSTDHIRMGLGRYTLSIETGGSTVQIQTKHYLEGDNKFRTAELPDGTTSTSTDVCYEIAGGLDVRLKCTTYVAAGSMRLSAIGE